MITVTHPFVSALADGSDASQIQPSNWNASHTVVDTSKGLTAWDYNFTAQTPGISLTAGIQNTVTLSPVPAGVNGTNVNHYLYISGGTGTAEKVKITGGTAVSGASSGTVTFTPAYNHTGSWTIASATNGFQEVIYAAWKTAKCVKTLGSAYNLDNTANCQVYLYAPLYFPPGWGNSYFFHGIAFTCMMGTEINDCIDIDTQDFGCIDFRGSEVFWPNIQNGASIVRIHPRNNNGEAATGMWNTAIFFPPLVPAQVSGQPGVLGNGLRFTALSSEGCAGIAGNQFFIAQVNGGRQGIVIDDVTSSGSNSINGNIFQFYVSNTGTGTTDGIVICSTANNYVYGNTWIGTVAYNTGTHLKSYAGGDTFILSIPGGSGAGVNFATGSKNNVLISNGISVSGTAWTNSGAGNIRTQSGNPTRTNGTINSSTTFTYFNDTGKDLSFFLSGSAITHVYTSADGTNYDDAGAPATNSYYPVKANMYIKIVTGGSSAYYAIYG